MFMRASEAVKSESSNLSEEAMPAILSNKANMLSSKRSACSASEAECYNMSLGAGPLWWS